MTTPTEPRTEAGRALLGALRYKGIVRLDDGYFEDTTPEAEIARIEAEAASQPEPAVTEALRRLDSLAQDESKNGDIAYAAGVTEATGQIRAALAGRPCPRCRSGFVIDDERREWKVCDCSAGKALAAELDRGLVDIREGRLHRWADIRRKP